jgi:hypothetical protein
MSNKGWMGLLDALFPDFSECADKAKPTDIIDFDQIQGIVDKAYPTIAEDQRLKSDKDCVIELPFNRILERYATAALEGLITTACRTYAAAHIIKTIPVFIKFNPSFSDTFSSAYAAYIVEDMETEFKDAQGDFVESFNTFKYNEFWYAFLEQAVQMYARKVDSGDIEPHPEALDALMTLNNVQESYKNEYPQIEPEPGTTIDDTAARRYLSVAKMLKQVGRFTTIKKFRNDKNLEVIFSNATTAKIILKHLVLQELNFVGKKFTKNLKAIDLGPEQSDTAGSDLDSDTKFWTSAQNYILSKLTNGSTLDMDRALEQEYIGLPTEDNPDPNNDGSEYPGPYYTNGGDFTTEDGLDYIGYYHVHEDSAGVVNYMKGEYHVDEAHDSLRPLMTKISVPIGSVSEYNTTSYSEDKIYLLERYISIDGSRMSPSDANAILAEVAAGYTGTLTEDIPNISDLYPGSLELVEDPFGTGQIVGLSGQLGVRCGLEFSLIVNGVKKVVTSVELDMLDTKINDIQPYDNNSRLLLCLVNMLKEDRMFELVTNYVFPINKILSSIAIYTDMSFISSIGEVCSAPGTALGPAATLSTKPGVNVTVQTDSDGYIESIETSANEGWAPPVTRMAVAGALKTTPMGMFVQEWDMWDKTTMRLTKSTLKRKFKRYYYDREFEVKGAQGPKAGDLMLKKLKGSLKPVPGQKLLPRWQRKRLRSNPFDEDGNLCDDK